MTCEAFLPKKFHAATLAVIEHANEIIAEYDQDGFSLTLRQLYLSICRTSVDQEHRSRIQAPRQNCE